MAARPAATALAEAPRPTSSSGSASTPRTRTADLPSTGAPWVAPADHTSDSSRPSTASEPSSAMPTRCAPTEGAFTASQLRPPSLLEKSDSGKASASARPSLASARSCTRALPAGTSASGCHAASPSQRRSLPPEVTPSSRAPAPATRLSGVGGSMVRTTGPSGSLLA
ncbi:MAG: hypothetical protein WKG00_31370 [Polyangiaceae bacterium]